MKKKRIMKIGMVGRAVTYAGNYRVNWGSTGNAYNRNSKSFNKRSTAIRFKNALIKKFQKQGYAIDYMYIAD